MPKHNSSQRKSSKTGRRSSGPGRTRRLSIRSELRRQPDVQKIAKAVIALAIAQAEKEAAEDAASRKAESDPGDVDD